MAIIIARKNSVFALAFLCALLWPSYAYQQLELNVENDEKSPNLIRIEDVTYEHINETTLLVSANVIVRETITYGTKVSSHQPLQLIDLKLILI